jgi:hypothetical protein
MIHTLSPSPSHSRAWPTLPRRAPARSPIEAILGERVSGPFTTEQIERLRLHVAQSIPPLPDAGLDQFLGTLMDSVTTVSAYFRPTRLVDATASHGLVEVVLPFDFALEAARKAAGMPSLLPQERALAWLAGFTYPVAHFYAADTSRGPDAFTQLPDAQRLQELRLALIEDPLRGLRRRHCALADTLGAALGCEPTDVCEPQQFARIVSAVRLATLRIQQLWTEVGDV